MLSAKFEPRRALFQAVAIFKPRRHGVARLCDRPPRWAHHRFSSGMIGPAFPVRCDAAEWQGRSRPAIPARSGKLTFIADFGHSDAIGGQPVC